MLAFFRRRAFIWNWYRAKRLMSVDRYSDALRLLILLKPVGRYRTIVVAQSADCKLLMGDEDGARLVYLAALRLETESVARPKQNSEYIRLYCKYSVKLIDFRCGDLASKEECQKLYTALISRRTTDRLKRLLLIPNSPL
jgi:hypothetical protein